MTLRAAQSRSTGLLGWCLVVLALCLLNLQGLQHYQPRMLIEGLCSASTDDSAPDGGAPSQRMHCGLCCAHAQTPAVPVAPAASFVAVARVERALKRMPAARPSAPAWQPGHPRGPPRAA